MAGVEFDVIEGRGARFARVVNGAGAATSLALVLGLGVWGYKLAVRDVTGVPVIRALEGPARVAPDDPGGELARHQGMAVNAIAADGTAAAPAETLTLAPRAGGLSDEDASMATLLGEDQAEQLAASMAGALPPVAEPAIAVATDALAVPLVRPGEPLPDGADNRAGDTSLMTEGAEDTALMAQILPSDVPGVAASPRPKPRPQGDAIAEAAALAVAAALGADTGGVDVALDELPAGTRLVQIGAFPSQDDARAEWERVAQRFGPLMSGKRRVILPAESGGSAFYRLRVEGFEDVIDARNFCDVLTSANAECVPTQVQ